MPGSIRRDYGYSKAVYYSFRWDAYWKQPKLWKQRNAFVKALSNEGFDVELFINPFRIKAVKDQEIFSIDLFEETGASILPVIFVKDPGDEPVYICDIPAKGQELPEDSRVGILNRRPKHLRLVRRLADATIFPLRKTTPSLEEELFNPKPRLVKYLIQCHAPDCEARTEYPVPRNSRNTLAALQKSLPANWSYLLIDLPGRNPLGAFQPHFFCSEKCQWKGCDSYDERLCSEKTQDVWEQAEPV